MIRKILKKLSWFILYLLFNAALFIIELKVLFKRDTSGYSGGSGVENVDDILGAIGAMFNILESIAMIGYFYVTVALAILALVLFIPVQVYYIKPKFTNRSKSFWYGLLASFAVVLVLKLLLYAWVFIDENYL
ncbi:unnamed protein product [Ectocarpus sp. 12 AP-2014]